MSSSGAMSGGRPRGTGHKSSRFQKSTIACDRCRQKKIRCEGAPLCSSCVSQNAVCHYSSTVRRYRGSSKEKARHLQEKLDNAERLLRTAGLLDQPVNVPPPAALQHSDHLGVLLQAANLPSEMNHMVSYPARDNVATSTSTQHQGPETYGQVGEDLIPLPDSVDTPDLSAILAPAQVSSPVVPYVEPVTIGSGSTERGVGLSIPLGNTVMSPESIRPFSVQDRRASLQASNSSDATAVQPHSQDTFGDTETPQHNHDEFHGLDSYLSICLDPGMGWIASRIGSSGFKSSATSLMSTINKKLSSDKRLGKERIPEPASDTAWEYVKTYFDESLEATYYLVNRQTFEARLKMHFNNSSSCDEDHAWYALRNVIYASGCRLLTFKSHGWTEAQSRSCGYFENALAVEAGLLHGAVGFHAIQALVAMALYTEGLGSPKLEHMLISCALRMAHSRGFHLRPSSPKIPHEDVQRMSWIFWTIYCLEKQLALRSGRPSHIDDDDISCELPTWAPDANPNVVEYFQHAVHQAKVSSAIMKTFMTVKAREQPSLQKTELVKHLDQSLRAWYEDLPKKFKPDFPVKQDQLPDGIRSEQLMYIWFSYYANLSAIHSIFGHPWNLTHSPEDQGTAVSEQVVSSTQALSEASRHIVLVARHISVDAYAPAWLVFHYPLIGMINMFVSVLMAPATKVPSKDIDLIDVAAGYFAYLEYATDSMLSFSFIRNLPQWAREVASKTSVSSSNEEQAARSISNSEFLFPMHYDSSNLFGNVNDFVLDDVDFGDWPAFLPRIPQVASWP